LKESRGGGDNAANGKKKENEKEFFVFVTTVPG
jgi:hypothetical protein